MLCVATVHLLVKCRCFPANSKEGSKASCLEDRDVIVHMFANILCTFGVL